MDITGRRILLTGGHGFFGQWVEEAFLKQDIASIYLPSHQTYDLRRRDNVERVFDKFKPHVVVHLAASVGGIEANFLNPGKFFYDNIVMGAEMMDVAREREVEKYVQVGTSCSYPDNAKHPMDESQLWNGRPNAVTGSYGVAKLALIEMAAAYNKQYGFKAITLIPPNLYGPKDSFDPNKSHVIPALIAKTAKAKAEGTSVEVWGDGDATREFLYVEDAARALVDATLMYDSPWPVNIGTGVDISIKEVAYTVARAMNFTGPVEFDPNALIGSKGRAFNVNLARHEFGFEASVSLAEGIEKTVQWYEDSYRNS